MAIRKLKTTLATLLIASTLATTASADIGEAVRSPVPGQVQVIAGQKLTDIPGTTDPATATFVAGTLKGKDGHMYGDITLKYTGIKSPTLETDIHKASLGLTAGPHFKVGDAYLLTTGGVVLPLTGLPTASGAFYATIVDKDTTIKSTKGTLDLGAIYRHDFAASSDSLELRATPAVKVGGGLSLGGETSVMHTFGGTTELKTGLLVRYTGEQGFHMTGTLQYDLAVTPGDDGPTVAHAAIYTVRIRQGLPKVTP